MDTIPITRPVIKKPEAENKLLTIPEHNILQLMNKMEILEKKMSDTAAFLGLYNEMKELEAKFMEAIEALDARGYKMADNVNKRVKVRKDKISRRR